LIDLAQGRAAGGLLWMR